MTVNASRDFAIFQDRTQGKTLDALGEKYGVSRERIRQIIHKYTQKAKNFDAMERRAQCAEHALAVHKSDTISAESPCTLMLVNIRAHNILHRDFYDKTVKDILEGGIDPFLSAKGCGRKTAIEIIKEAKRICDA